MGLLNDSTEKSRRRQLPPLEGRFLRYGLKDFSSPEMMELLLCRSLPSKDCKQIVRGVVAKYKTLGEFLTAPTQELEKIPGMTPRGVLVVKLMREIPSQFLKEKLVHKHVHISSQEIFDYLYYTMRGLQKEVFKVVYLDSQNQIIDSEDLFEGTLDGIHI